MHITGSRDKVQKLVLWLLSLLDEGHNAKVAWILAVYLSKKALGIKEKSDILEEAFYRLRKKLSPIKPLKAPPQSTHFLRNEPSGLDSMLIFHQLADEAGHTIPTAFDPPNVPLYPYPYVPYPYPYTHYPDMVRYEIGGSTKGVQDDDDDEDMSDQLVHSEDCVARDDDIDD
ncbi:hypothetical protein Tco_0110398 [Tanacetum coccineum]